MSKRLEVPKSIYSLFSLNKIEFLSILVDDEEKVSDIVAILGGNQKTINSREVAEMLGKEHKHILQYIEGNIFILLFKRMSKHLDILLCYAYFNTILKQSL